ncbi:hypothetical protein DXG03_001519 [Asterophora parasitica]|uniref:Uncharacterized protein n=1 Tax=Asterophora parasitica TaxID=117018 RepID=A0A9P7G5A2_9AGAR|nr:hypothetical protein DXG03_001519 [Asterophora parasitica]
MATTSAFVRTTIGGRQGVIWDGEVGKSTTAHSLIISPNLDALLEYDEKVRGMWNAAPTTPTSPTLWPPVDVVGGHMGLPPPPRRNSRVTLKPGGFAQSPPPTPRIVSPLMQEVAVETGPASGSTWPAPISPLLLAADSNPYINPGPRVEKARDRRRSAEWTGDSDESRRDGSQSDAQGGGSSTQHVVRGGPGNRLLGIGKLPFGLLIPKAAAASISTASSGLNDVSNTKLQERARAKGKLLKLKDTGDRTAQRKMSADLRSDLPRALLSHGSWSRRSSVSSSSSTSHGPASTIDGRISISSTIYPASSAHSHPHHMYDDPSVVREESFIEIASPPTPAFQLPELYHHRNHSEDKPQPEPESGSESPEPDSPEPAPSRRTTNFLHLDERSDHERLDLIRKNRKLAQVFGQPPHPDAFLQSTRSKSALKPPLPRHNRGALSTSGTLDEPDSWLPALEYMNLHSRRHSAPLTPDDLSFLMNDTNDDDDVRSDIHAPDQISSDPRPSSPTSFIDLSDDPGTPRKKASAKSRGHRRPSSPSAQSLFENMSPEEQAEDVRRRKREKLAKVHRFLGSRVPTNLVLGFNDSEPTLPPLDPTMDPLPENEEASSKAWLRRRRSSSAAAYSSAWSDEVDRLKEDLNLKEKAINVRRAQKMEKVFGVAPPQTLYHTRRSPSPSISGTAAHAVTGHKMISGWTSPGESPPPITGLRNPNRSTYSNYTKHKSSKSKDNRPSTSESNKALLPKNSADYGYGTLRKRTSAVYSHYEESLNSLHDIIDRDDRESLAELHVYLNSGDMSVPPPLQPQPQLQSFTRAPPSTTAADAPRDRRLSNASSIKSERRRSLPARTSLLSLASQASGSTTFDSPAGGLELESPKPDATDFQARRRRAAKLTQFFGVDYTELIKDVLESIESGLEHERKRGTLDPEEVELI